MTDERAAVGRLSSADICSLAVRALATAAAEPDLGRKGYAGRDVVLHLDRLDLIRLIGALVELAVVHIPAGVRTSRTLEVVLGDAALMTLERFDT